MLGTAEYLENQVLTASPYRLHLMVVDGAVRFARRALEALEAHNREAAHLALNRSREFITELLGGLDEGHSSELTTPLKELFLYAYRNLVRADFDRDPKIVRDAIRVLEMHRETWIILGEQLGQEHSPAPDQPAQRSWCG